MNTEKNEKQCCHNCRFGGVYECRKNAPIITNEGLTVFPNIYNNGLGTWCGDYQIMVEK
jgi:hypothetical protein